MPLLGKVNAVVTDPPYGVNLGEVKNGQATEKGQQKYSQFSDTPEYVERVAVTAIEQARERFHRVVLTPGLRCAWLYPPPDDLGAWFIPAAASRTKWGFATSQPILFYGKNPRAGKGDTPTGVSMSPIADKTNKHPCPKPLKFAEWLVIKATLEQEMVLDPFMGSGTTGVACVKTGRSFIGIELDADYFDIAVKRIKEAHMQPDMFTEVLSPIAPLQEDFNW